MTQCCCHPPIETWGPGGLNCSRTKVGSPSQRPRPRSGAARRLCSAPKPTLTFLLSRGHGAPFALWAAAGVMGGVALRLQVLCRGWRGGSQLGECCILLGGLMSLGDLLGGRCHRRQHAPVWPPGDWGPGAARVWSQLGAEVSARRESPTQKGHARWPAPSLYLESLRGCEPALHLGGAAMVRGEGAHTSSQGGFLFPPPLLAWGLRRPLGCRRETTCRPSASPASCTHPGPQPATSGHSRWGGWQPPAALAALGPAVSGVKRWPWGRRPG